MADRRNALPGEQWSELSDGELDNLLDDGFEKMMGNSNICSLEEIDISRPNWEVVLHFDDKDPRKTGSAAAKDYWKLEEWSAIGIFQMDSQRAPATVVTLRYDENCGSDKFSPEQIALFKKYRPLISAPPASRRLPDVGTKVQIEAALVVLLAGPKEDVYETVNPEDEGVSLVEEDSLNKIFEIDFELLILKFPGDTEGLEAILTRLKMIAVDEELDIEIARAFEPIEIYISKNDEVTYRKTLDAESLQYLKQFAFTLV